MTSNLQRLFPNFFLGLFVVLISAGSSASTAIRCGTYSFPGVIYDDENRLRDGAVELHIKSDPTTPNTYFAREGMYAVRIKIDQYAGQTDFGFAYGEAITSCALPTMPATRECGRKVSIRFDVKKGWPVANSDRYRGYGGVEIYSEYLLPKGNRLNYRLLQGYRVKPARYDSLGHIVLHSDSLPIDFNPDPGC